VALADLRDESLVSFYESIHDQVNADRDQKYKFMTGQSVREYAETLRGEITRRRLQCTPILWPWDPDQQPLNIRSVAKPSAGL
jgi:hypothetical protein